jgi:hypothetical protein
MEAWCTATHDGPCDAFLADAVPVQTGDGHAGLGSFGASDTMAFFVDGDRLYVLAIWRPDTDPTVLPYGGARRLLEAYLSTFSIVEPPPPSPAAT